MATARQRYTSQLQQDISPNIDFAGQREQVRGAKTIAAQIDRMSQQFLSQATEEAKIEGAEYGILNAPTQKQILDAKEKGIDIKLPGGTGSVYERAVRKAALMQANDEITVLAKKDILGLITKAELAELPAEVVKRQIEEVTSGYASVFDETSPILARQFRADMGVYGYTKYGTYASAQLVENRKKAKANFFTNFMLLKEGVQGVIKNFEDIDAFVDNEDGSGVMPNPNNDTGQDIKAHTLVQDHLDNQKAKILSQAVELNMSTSQIKIIADEWDAEVLQARGNIVRKEIMSHEAPKTLIQNMKAAANGKTTGIESLPPSVRNAFLSEDADGQKKLIDDARSAWHDRIGDVQKDINHNNALREDRVNKASINFNNGIAAIATSSTGLITTELNKQITDALAVIKVDAPDKYIEMRDNWLELSTTVADGSSTMFPPSSDVGEKFKFDRDLVSDTQLLSLVDVNKAFLERKLSREDYLSISKSYKDRQDPRMAEAFKLIRIEVGIPENSFADKAFLDSQAVKVMNSAQANIMRLASEDTTGVFDPVKWVNENIGDFIKAKTNDAFAPLKSWGKKRTYKGTMKIISTLRAEGGNVNNAKADELLQKITELEDAVKSGRINISDVPGFDVEGFAQ